MSVPRVRRRPILLKRPHLHLTGGAAAAALIVAVAALVWRHAAYGEETHQLADAAIAQDLVTVFLAAPVLALMIRRAAFGSGRAYLIGLGALSFLAYNYAIYCFSITFGPLFLPWTALLGVSTFLLAAGFARAEALELDALVRPSRMAAITLCGVATIFAGLWLSEIFADLSHGAGSASANRWQVPTNPVHVLDLAFFLPAAAAAGLSLLKGRRWALTLAPVMLTFFVLTSIPIVVTPFVQVASSHTAAWTVVAPVSTIAAVSLIALFKVLAQGKTNDDVRTEA